MFNRIIWTWSFYHNQKFRSLFLMLKKWIMFNSTFCVQLKVNYWLSEEVGGSPRLGRLALKMFRMQTCSSTHASMLQVQYIGFSCFFIKQSSTCFHVHCQCKWWEIFLVSAILTYIYLSSSYIGMNEFSRKCLNNSINRCQSSKCNIPLDKYLKFKVLWFQNVSNFAYPVPEPDWMVFVCPGWERWQQYWPSDIVCARCQWMTIYDIHDIFMVIHVMYHAKYKHHQRTLYLTNIKFLPPTTHAAF